MVRRRQFRSWLVSVAQTGPQACAVFMRVLNLRRRRIVRAHRCISGVRCSPLQYCTSRRKLWSTVNARTSRNWPGSVGALVCFMFGLYRGWWLCSPVPLAARLLGFFSACAAGRRGGQVAGLRTA